MKEIRQLFTIVRDINIPSYLRENACSVTYEKKTAISFIWPDGTPCAPVEMFLLEKGDELTVRDHDGGSLKTWASHLTHLTRFCFEKNIQFWDLDDTRFKDFVVNYLGNQKLSARGFVKRKNNTNITIIRSCISFLQWLQSTISHDRIIVGPREISPQIRLIEKVSYRSRHEKAISLV